MLENSFNLWGKSLYHKDVLGESPSPQAERGGAWGVPCGELVSSDFSCLSPTGGTNRKQWRISQQEMCEKDRKTNKHAQLECLLLTGWVTIRFTLYYGDLSASISGHLDLPPCHEVHTQCPGNSCRGITWWGKLWHWLSNLTTANKDNNTGKKQDSSVQMSDKPLKSKC